MPTKYNTHTHISLFLLHDPFIPFLLLLFVIINVQWCFQFLENLFKHHVIAATEQKKKIFFFIIILNLPSFFFFRFDYKYIFSLLAWLYMHIHIKFIRRYCFFCIYYIIFFFFVLWNLWIEYSNIFSILASNQFFKSNLCVYVLIWHIK